MRKLISIFSLAACAVAVDAQIELLPDETPQLVFAGHPQKIRAVFRNPKDKSAQLDLRTRLYQLSSATKMPVGEAQHWKKLEVLAGQTVIELVPVSTPAVKTATRFQVQWLDEKDKPVAQTTVSAYPDDLLKQLKTLAGEKPIGLMDPNNQIKPLLKRLAVDFEDLEVEPGWPGYQGKLAIAGPFALEKQMGRDLGDKIAKASKEGVAVVWIQPPSGKLVLSPSSYLVQRGEGTVVVAQASTVSALGESPLSQLNLIHFAELALKPELLRLPDEEQR